jgi:hypothetical protein
MYSIFEIYLILRFQAASTGNNTFLTVNYLTKSCGSGRVRAFLVGSVPGPDPRLQIGTSNLFGVKKVL